MSNVLGSQSYLATPDVNGALVLTTLTGVSTLTGSPDQISITGTLPSYTIGLASDPIIPGSGALTLVSGTTAQRPVTPTAGMTRYNSTISKTEYYNGVSWIPSGQVIQQVSGTITKTSSNSQIPFDTTVPTNAEGLQLWSQSFTPLLADSTIYITTNTFFIINSANDVVVSGATFSDTTNINAQALGFGTTTGAGNAFNVIASEISASTTARTYSFRAGPNSNVTIFYARGITATYGTAITGTYTITEVAP